MLGCNELKSITPDPPFGPGKSVKVSSMLLGHVLIGRAAFVFPLSFLSNLAGKYEKINLKKQVTIWWLGLMHGCLHGTLSNQFTRSDTKLWGSVLMITSTITVILFSTVVFGLLTKPLVRILLLVTKYCASMISFEPSSPKSFTQPPLSNGHDSESHQSSKSIPRPSSLPKLLSTPSHTVHHYW